MHDVAKLAGVSLKTVSRVVNQEPRVDQQTRVRVEAAIAELGFRPNGLASSLRRGQASLTIGLIIEDIGNPFYSQIARGVEEIADQHNYMVIISSNEKQAKRERELVSALLRRRVEGLLIVPASNDHRYMLPEVEHGTHVVFIDRPPTHLAADVILFDNRGGARRGIEYLLAQGHRRIGFIGGDPTVYTGSERLAGYRDALTASNVPLDEKLMCFSCHDILQAEAAAHQLLSLPQPPSAIFADNNRMSVGAIRALRARNPQVTLLGFDDIELADMLSLPITVVTHDPTEMGKQAAYLLFGRIAGDRRLPQRLVLPTQLIVRDAGTFVTELH
ncbi:MAG TPA: LacI family DNA-binding transcriptional regulator [Ktedonobacteraceae bacterium]|nr:LacI family DNA-binding transcriptional regulator [Ktedonobacteraceae bacterium]